MNKTINDPKFNERLMALCDEAEALTLSLLEENEVIDLREVMDIDIPLVNEWFDGDPECNFVTYIGRENGKVIYSTNSNEWNDIKDDEQEVVAFGEFCAYTDIFEIFSAVRQIKGIEYND